MQPNYRRCVSCRQVAHRQDLLRVVRTYPTGTVQLNQGAGRSAYLCCQVACLNSAQKKNRLGRSLKTSIPNDIYRQLEQILKEAIQSPE
ncbi:YlxR family protein [Leptothoe sp. PORK10 BA2]|uniref:YlxR family protein n=1 Tax=Leptothoe sp. PORK10 BA2 TaxID=3110254 RepID=UPI002B204A74|nr:YlxR family protein [Leptothoe sp. PORK10 BA2]MEA5462975.1 YlxR family protein [Leptothoe sp. PORK10 BA2]